MKISKEPMMSKAEIKIIDDLLVKYKPKLCLEWGAGGSTLYFPVNHKFIKLWQSIEHNGHYVNYLKDSITDNVSLIWADAEWYIDSVKLGRKYDFILVDGEFREECVAEGITMLNPKGILLLHDSGRAEYQGFIKEFKGEKLIDGEIPQGDYFAHRGLTLFRGNRDSS